MAACVRRTSESWLLALDAVAFQMPDAKQKVPFYICQHEANAFHTSTCARLYFATEHGADKAKRIPRTSHPILALSCRQFDAPEIFS